MKLLYVGDIMGELGIRVVERELPSLKQTHSVDVIIAQAENVTEGRGINLVDMQRLQAVGVDFFTGGNHSFDQPSIFNALEDPARPIIRPANYPAGTPGLGHKYLKTESGDILIVSLLGQIVGKHAATRVDNPLKVIDSILAQEAEHKKLATVINFHGDFSSEKVIIGHYLDGRATLVIGDHWHVPTADAQVQTKSTAYMTDAGMCGALDSSLGVTFDSVIPRWRDELQTQNVLEMSGRTQFSGLLVDFDPETQMARSVKHIYKIK